VLPTDRARINLAQPDTIGGVVRDLAPDVIINAAAHTAVDRAESEAELAFRINAESVGVLAEEARRIGAVIVHFSTDYIFDGRATRPYRPDDPPSPQSVYGRSKLAGEVAVVNSGAKFLILRTCWVYALRGRNFLLAMLAQAQVRPEVRVVNDQTGSPTWARTIARSTASILASSLGGSARSRHFQGLEGIYHVACAGTATWFDFAKAIYAEARLPDGGPRVIPVSSVEFAAKAQRPAYSVLDCSKTIAAFGVALPDWRSALREAMSDGESGGPLPAGAPGAQR
jgi:dTDP-4-dehydrorhamnose reductase